MKDSHYLPRYFFDFAVWALDRNWDDPNKYVSMVYHWDGYESFRLTHRGPPNRTYNVSGRSLIVLNATVGGSLASCSKPIQFDHGASGSALLSDNDIVIQVRAEPGWQSVTVDELKSRASRTASVKFIDALTGTANPPGDVALAWHGNSLKVRFKVPDRVNGADNKKPAHLAYVVLHGAA
jgi:hypothetical protein